MAIEPRRGCGYRKVGGLYIVSGGLGDPCCKLPILLKVCPTCGGGVKQTRGWTWIDPRPWLKGPCSREAFINCPAASAEAMGDRVGLLWIGEKFYPTPAFFVEEANRLGISRRITAIPRGFKVGEHWVFLAHPKVKLVLPLDAGPTDKADWVAGIFRIFKPDRIEKIVTETMAKDEAEMAKLAEHNITPVIVPDDDKDHQGTVYDEEPEAEPELELTEAPQCL